MIWLVIKRRSSTSMITWVLPSLVWQLMLVISANLWEVNALTTGTLMTVITQLRDWSLKSLKSHKSRLNIQQRDPSELVSWSAHMMKLALTCLRQTHQETTMSILPWLSELDHNLQRLTLKRTMSSSLLILGKSLSSMVLRHWNQALRRQN